ncbi:unnamed protein product, partial [marine sediment metagenome]
QAGGAMKSLDKFGLMFRLGNTFVSYVRYIGKTIWPNRLAVFYPHVRDNLPGAQVAGAVLLLAVITFFVLRSRHKHRYLLVGWFWFVGTLVPVIGLVQVGVQALADRYTYLPIIGLFIIIAWGVSIVSVRWRYKNAILGTAGVVVVLAMIILTRLQVGYWQNNQTLFEHALSATKKNYVAHN